MFTIQTRPLIEYDSSQQALILSSPSGLVEITSTLFFGWYSDKKVRKHVYSAAMTDV